MICKVAFPVPLDKTFDYAVPSGMEAALRPGVRVSAPFGRVVQTGFVVETAEQSDLKPGIQLKSISSVLDSEPLFGNDFFLLADFIAGRWGCPQGLVLEALLPRYVRQGVQSRGKASQASPQNVVQSELSFMSYGQVSAVETIGADMDAGRSGEFLLFGDASTGKTEVYLKLIEKAFAAGGQALLLVPDIALTAPVESYIASRFGAEKVVVWHSRISQAERRKLWLRVAAGEQLLIIGTRSASLLPFKNLRIAVVDEEQDDIYKQEDSRPYYHVREVLMFRCGFFKCPLVLGGCAPSLESLQMALQEKMHLVRMKTENASGARIVITGRKGAHSQLLSEELYSALQDKLARKEQSLLIMNRKGYSTAYACLNCGWFPHCHKCAGTLVLHKTNARDKGILVCPSCGRKEPLPQSCPKCRNMIFKPVGAGTQRIAAELKKLFPAAKVSLIDADIIAAGSESVEKLQLALEADIIVGTRLAARGHYVSKLGLVAVLDADTELAVPDFRAAEKTAQLLFQTAGRLAGRGGDCIVQTSRPDEYVFAAFASGDYIDFAMKELELRRELLYPPFGRLARFIVSAPTNEAAEKICEQASSCLRAKAEGLSMSEPEDFEILGPVPSFGGRKSKLVRLHMLIKTHRPELITEFLRCSSSLKPGRPATVKIIADPYNFH